MSRIGDDRLAGKTARAILKWFEIYIDEFNEMTRRARRRFECRDWKGRHSDTLERLDLYDKILDRLAPDIRSLLGERVCEKPLWTSIRERFSSLIERRFDADRARTFYNSVTRKIFSTVGIDREIEFFTLEQPRHEVNFNCGICKKYPPGREILSVIRNILLDHSLDIGHEDMERDAALVAREVSLRLWPIIGFDKVCTFEMIEPIFFRNKAAYIVGRIIADSRVIPIVMPIYNGSRGVYVDTVILAESEVSIILGFATPISMWTSSSTMPRFLSCSRSSRQNRYQNSIPASGSTGMARRSSIDICTGSFMNRTRNS